MSGDECRYCGNVLELPMDNDYIHFCNEDCLGNYIIVQIFKAKMEIERMGLNKR